VACCIAPPPGEFRSARWMKTRAARSKGWASTYGDWRQSGMEPCNTAPKHQQRVTQICHREVYDRREESRTRVIGIVSPDDVTSRPGRSSSLGEIGSVVGGSDRADAGRRVASARLKRTPECFVRSCFPSISRICVENPDRVQHGARGVTLDRDS
jgi:hypothetical protein